VLELLFGFAAWTAKKTDLIAKLYCISERLFYAKDYNYYDAGYAVCKQQAT